MERSAETGERSQHQQQQGYVASDLEYHRLQQQAPIMSEATMADEFNSFYGHFDLLRKLSAVKSALPPEE